MTATTTTLTLNTPVPASKAEQLAQIATAIQSSPLANGDMANLVKVVADVATTTGAGISGNPVAIVTTSLNLFADLCRLGPEMVDAWNGFISLFHKKVTEQAKVTSAS